jgi:peptide/nickel transport system ATP-binding protein
MSAEASARLAAPWHRNAPPVLDVQGLTITYRGPQGRQAAVRDVSFAINPREAYGLVGESGCGKSTLAFAVMRHLPANGRVVTGRVLFDGKDLLRLSGRELQRLRGEHMAMVYQDPGSALNPAMRIGDQVAEVYQIHKALGRTQARAAAVEMLDRVRMPGAANVAQRFPHQLSGGMQQRTVIAMALATNPSLLILDEPTTGLDATVEAAILDLVASLRAEFNTAILFISHHLAVVARICDRVGVLYAGELVEQGATAELFSAPHHPYTAGLLASVPRFGAHKDEEPLVPIAGRMPRPGEETGGCTYAPRCPLAREVCHTEKPPLVPTTRERLARCFFWPQVASLRPVDRRQATGDKRQGPGASVESGAAEKRSGEVILDVKNVVRHFGRPSHPVRAVDGVSFAVRRGQVFGLVGESGSGKSTLARCIAGLLTISGGMLTLEGRDISQPVEKRDRSNIKRIQMVFQSPEATLNPRQTVRQILARTARALTSRRGATLRERVEELARLVYLDATLLDTYPGALSGGQRQRVAIARAFAGDPDLVLCDEPVSSLDVSVQAAILNLLADVQKRKSVSYVFISHDLAVVRYLADQIGVMYLGSLVEVGPVDRVFAPPSHPYTETLLASMTTLDGTRSSVRAEGSIPSPAAIPSGCPFHTRCPRIPGEQCRTQEPPWQRTEEGHAYRCWILPDELVTLQQAVSRQPSAVSQPEAGG